MIGNLPKKINLKELNAFNFGDIEASEDEMLIESVCRTASITEFINGRKNIVLGEKGTGKTALFRLISEEKFVFQQNNEYQNVVIPIADNFQYKSIKSKLLKLIEIDEDDEIYKFQIVWELFIFRKIISKIKNIGNHFPKEVIRAIELTNNLFNDHGLENLVKSKTTFGIKLYDTQTSILPDFYLTSEPIFSSDRIRQDSMEKLEIDLDYFKQIINLYLIDNQLNFIIIIDRLDEFVSKTAAQTQLRMLEALIAVEREFAQYSNLELKIFMRDDLFKQLSFDGIGYDKVISKKVDLIWTPEKIREFIAKRICLNYKTVFKLDHLYLNVDRESLEIDTTLDSNKYVRPVFYVRWYRSIIKRLNPNHYAQKFPKKVNLNDKINREIILSIFPKYVEFRNEEGKLTEIEIFDYFANNFNLGTGNSIPRLILIFLKKWLTITNNYYLENQDELPIQLNEQNCYELVKKGFFEKAYDEFKEEIYLSFAKLNPDFENNIKLFREKIGYRFTFRAKELKGLLKIQDDEELFHFCDYMCHIGYFERINSSTTIENMKFKLPLMFRKINNS